MRGRGIEVGRGGMGRWMRGNVPYVYTRGTGDRTVDYHLDIVASPHVEWIDRCESSNVSSVYYYLLTSSIKASSIHPAPFSE
jgi:hypothetical protein